MHTTLKLTAASIKMFLRNRQALFFSLFMPLIIMMIFGFIGFDKPPKIDVGLVSAASLDVPTAAFVDQVKQFPIFTISEDSLEDEMKKLQAGDLSAIIQVAPGAVLVYKNAGEAGQASTVVSVLTQFADKMTLAQAQLPPVIRVNDQEVNAHNLHYIEFLLPGLIAMSVMQMSVFSVAFVFAQFKEKGVLKRLLATPMRPVQFVTANIITRLLVAVLQAIIFVIVGILLFHVHVIGSYWLLLLSIVLGAVMFLGMGFTISGVAKTVDSVPALGNLLVFPMLFLGGVFIPISNMPVWLQWIAKFLPLTYFSGALRDVMTKGAGFFDIGWDLVGMLVWGIILVFLSTVTFSFQEKEAG